MPSARDPLISGFLEEVVEPLSVVVPGRTQPLGFREYLALPEGERGGDEASVVDDQFTRRLLAWLGWGPSNYRYNAPEAGRGKSVQRPDFRVFSRGSTAFVVEDKATVVGWSLERLPQLRKYASGTTGLALWTNLREMHLLRFGADGGYKTLAAASVETLAGVGQQSLLSGDEDALRLVYDLLNRRRFEEFEGLLESAVSDDERVPLTDREALDEFISGARTVLDGIGRSAAAQVRAAQVSGAERLRENESILRELQRNNEALLDRGWSEADRNKLLARAEAVEKNLGSLSAEDTDLSAGSASIKVPERAARAAERWRRVVLALDARKRNVEMARRGHSGIVDAFSLWSRLQPDQSADVATVERFSEQVAYVVFVRLVLARILEDKGILPARIVANGGFGAWRNLVEERFASGGESGTGTVHGEEYLRLLFRTVSGYYDHFFGQPIFDWYETDDFSLVSLLSHLNMYDFSEITSDIIGYTYEHYVNRWERGRKGQFLTRAGLVEYVLDEVGYEADPGKVIGRRLLDHACGSGSFLIHAAQILRRAQAEASARVDQGGFSAEELLSRNGRHRTEGPRGADAARAGQGGSEDALREARIAFAERYLEAVSRDIVGTDIDPFACYLAELNLLVQVLDDLALFWTAGRDAPLGRFQVFNSDGLTLPERVLDSAAAGTEALSYGEDPSAPLDEGWPVKSLSGEFAERFDFVVANPPYVTPKKQAGFSEVVKRRFFDEDVVSGDPNLYLCFLRLAEYYLADGGRAGVIVPVGLCGDESGEKARRLLSGGRLRLFHLTRFLSSTVLFEDVDQWMMVAGFEAGDASRPDSKISLRQGMTEEDSVAGGTLEVAAPRVIRAAPSGDQHRLPEPWRSPWLNAGEETIFSVWETAKSASSSFLFDLFDGQVRWKQGDVNTNAAKPFRRENGGPGLLPAYTGAAARPFAPLPEADGWVEPPGREPSGRGPARVLYELANVDGEKEVGFVLPVQANLHINRRLRGTWFERDATGSAVFLHSLWRFVAEPGCETRAKALLGLTTSSLLNYLFGMWSTNFNVGIKLLMRLPCPPADTFPEGELALTVEGALAAREGIENLIAGTSWGRFEDGAVRLDAGALLESAGGVRKTRLSDAELSGAVRVEPGRSRKVGKILEQGRLSSPHSGYAALLDPFLEPHSDEQWDAVKATLSVPRHDATATWNEQLRQERFRAEELAREFTAASERCDDLVLGWYGFGPGDPLREEVNRGLPWQYRNARRRRDLLLGDTG